VPPGARTYPAAAALLGGFDASGAEAADRRDRGGDDSGSDDPDDPDDDADVEDAREDAAALGSEALGAGALWDALGAAFGGALGDTTAAPLPGTLVAASAVSPLAGAATRRNPAMTISAHPRSNPPPAISRRLVIT
jgi:hypothetical protein